MGLQQPPNRLARLPERGRHHAEPIPPPPHGFEWVESAAQEDLSESLGCTASGQVCPPSTDTASAPSCVVRADIWRS
jgi:hypothetical protein